MTNGSGTKVRVKENIEKMKSATENADALELKEGYDAKTFQI